VPAGLEEDLALRLGDHELAAFAAVVLVCHVSNRKGQGSIPALSFLVELLP
jgi:hypothetical protein